MRGVRRRAADVPQQAAVRGRRRRLGDGGGELPHASSRRRSTSCTAATSCARPRSCRSARAHNPKIEFLLSHRVVAVEGGHGRRAGPRAVDLKTNAERDDRRRPACSSRSATSRTPRSSTASSRRDDQGYVVTTPGTTQTSVAGRVRRRRRARTRSTARRSPRPASGCMAALEAEQFLASSLTERTSRGNIARLGRAGIPRGAVAMSQSLYPVTREPNPPLPRVGTDQDPRGACC